MAKIEEESNGSTDADSQDGTLTGTVAGVQYQQGWFTFFFYKEALYFNNYLLFTFELLLLLIRSRNLAKNLICTD